MKILIKKLKTRTFDEEFRERGKKLLRDILAILFIILISIKIEQWAAGKTLFIFEETYRLEILMLYIIGFAVILTSGYLFTDIRDFMNIISRFVITRFPRMKGDFGPGKRIFRNMVHIILMVLIFYPVSSFLKQYSFTFFSKQFELLYIGSLFFLVLTLLFVYDIMIQIYDILTHNYGEVRKIVDKRK